MAALIFSRRAKRDLARIGDWIARDDPVRAATFIGELEDACAGLLAFPSAYSPLAEFEAAGLRKRTYGNYRIVYRATPGKVRIVAILHAARDISPLI